MIDRLVEHLRVLLTFQRAFIKRDLQLLYVWKVLLKACLYFYERVYYIIVGGVIEICNKRLVEEFNEIVNLRINKMKKFNNLRF